MSGYLETAVRGWSPRPDARRTIAARLFRTGGERPPTLRCARRWGRAITGRATVQPRPEQESGEARWFYPSFHESATLEPPIAPVHALGWAAVNRYRNAGAHRQLPKQGLAGPAFDQT